MAREPQPAPIEVEPDLEAEADRVARLATELAVDPPFRLRLVKPADHGDYLEASHESTLRTLAVVHMRLAKGDIDGALDLITKLRAHLDSLWDQRKEAAERLVKP